VYSNYKDPRTPVQFARVFRYFIAGAMVLAASLSVFSREILIVLTTEAYYSAVLVIPFLVVSTFLSGMYVFAPGLGIAKKTKLIASINFVGAFVNVILNIALIPTFGIVGAAVSTLISSIGIFVVNMFASQREYKIPHDTKKLMLSVIIASVLGTIGYFVNAYSVVLTIGAKFLVLGLLVVALVVLRLVDMDEIRMYLLKHREHSRLESNSPKA
jgi:O-antigen/teichoic acid export membrane protein